MPYALKPIGSVPQSLQGVICFNNPVEDTRLDLNRRKRWWPVSHGGATIGMHSGRILLVSFYWVYADRIREGGNDWCQGDGRLCSIPPGAGSESIWCSGEWAKTLRFN